MPLPTTSNTPNPESQGLHCRINDNYYRLNNIPAPPRIQTAPLQAPRIDTAANPEDITNEYGVFYSLSDFTGGEGLDYVHRPSATELDSTRFWSSEDIDTSRSKPGQATTMRLAPKMEDHSPVTPNYGGFPSPLAFFDDELYIKAQSQDVYRVDNPLSSTPTFNLEDPDDGEGAGDIRALLAHGNHLYAVRSLSDIHRRDTSGTWSHWSDLVANNLWSVKGRILGDSGNGLYEVKDGVNSVLLHDLGSGGFWRDVAEVGGFIVAVASDGFAYLFTLDEDTATVALVSRLFLSDGEITSIAPVSGTDILFFATNNGVSQRVYQAQMSPNGAISNARVVKEFLVPSGSTSPTEWFSIHDIMAHHDSVYFLGPDEFVWKYDLVTGGRFRLLSLGGLGFQARYGHLAFYRDVVFVTPYSGEPEYYKSTDDYAATGHLITGLVDHFSADDKSTTGLSLDLPQIPVGSAIRAYYSTDPTAINDPNHASWTLLKNITRPTAGDPGTDTSETVIGDQSRYITIKIEMDRGDDPTESPELRSLAVRSFPGPGDIILSLPINTSDQIEVPGRHRLTIPRLGDAVYNTLRDLEGTSVEAELFDPSETIRGVVTGIESPIPMAGVDGSETLTSMVTIRGRRA